jgi:hypothetical protein
LFILSIASITRLGFHRIGLLQQLDQHGRDYLPRHSEFVCKPSALILMPSRRKLSQ